MSNANSVEMVPLNNSRANEPHGNGNSDVEFTRDNPGIDDGLMDTGPSVPHPSDEPSSYPDRTDDGYIPLPSNPRPGTAPKPKKPLDVNLYATKKTVAQGMMDLALLTANSNQLRYVLEGGQHSGPYFYVSIFLISLSIILQVVTGVALILLGRYNMRHNNQASKADRLNNWVVLGVFLITVINVFISSFGIHPVEMDPALIVDATLSSMRTHGELVGHALPASNT